MSDNDIVKRNRALIVNALANLRQEWEIKLNQLKEKAAELSSRPDIVWHMIVQSLSGMGNNRGYFNLIENQENYNRICWQRIASVSENERLRALSEALSLAKVRMASRKAKWLYINYGRIQEMGGIDGARQIMGALQGYDVKISFFQQFMGISEKYGRNIWMDLYDKDFRDSIAIDTRIKLICGLIGVQTHDYRQAEIELLTIARKAGRDGWEMDRVLFHFNQEFGALLSNSEGSQINTHQDAGFSEGVAFGFSEEHRKQMVDRLFGETRLTNSLEKKHTMTLSTTAETIQRTKQRLSASGFNAQVLPGKRGIRGQGDFVVSSPDTRKFAKVRVKGHGDVNNPCWFSLTFFDEDIQTALEKNINRDEAWRCNVAKYDFFILASLPLNRMWLFTPQEIMDLIEINLKKYDWAKERETHKKVEMNFSVDVDGKWLSKVEDYDGNLINDANEFTLLRNWLTN